MRLFGACVQGDGQTPGGAKADSAFQRKDARSRKDGRCQFESGAQAPLLLQIHADALHGCLRFPSLLPEDSALDVCDRRRDPARVDRSLSLPFTGWRMTREDEDLSPPCATWPGRASSRPKLSRDLGFGLSILAQRSGIRTIGPTIRARFIFHAFSL